MKATELPQSNCEVYLICNNESQECKGFVPLYKGSQRCKYFEDSRCSSLIEGVQALNRELKEYIDESKT